MKVMDKEKSVLQWGGLAGILGSFSLIFAFVAEVGFGPSDIADAESLVMGFPDVKAALVVGNITYLAALILWVPLFLALYRALRGTSLAPALFGSVLGVLGLVVLAASALVIVAYSPISDLYHAAETTPADQATLVLLWQANQGILDMLLAAGFFLLPLGLVVLGVAMLGAPTFGKGFGGASVVIGVVGIVAAYFNMLDPASLAGAIVLVPLIVFLPVLGWKVYRLSRVM